MPPKRKREKVAGVKPSKKKRKTYSPVRRSARIATKKEEVDVSDNVVQPVDNAEESDMKVKTTFDRSKHWKFMSWNVNGIRALLRKDNSCLKRLLKRENPHVLFLQEIKADAKTAGGVVGSTVQGYAVHWNECTAKKGYSGTAVYISDDLKVKDVTFGSDDEGRVITVETEDLYLIGTYVPNSGAELVRLDYRIKTWERRTRTYLKELEKTKPVVYMGDLNVAHEEIDLHNPKGNERSAGFTKEERTAFSQLLDEGFVDTFRYFFPDLAGQYTYWGYRFNARANDKGWRLDYFVVSQPLVPSLVDSYILKRVMGSDHCPLGLILDQSKVAK